MEIAAIPRMVHQFERGARINDEKARSIRRCGHVSPDHALVGGIYRQHEDYSTGKAGRPGVFIESCQTTSALPDTPIWRARIIDARREPMALLLQQFTQLFANGQEFTYSLDD